MNVGLKDLLTLDGFELNIINNSTYIYLKYLLPFDLVS